MLHSVVIERFHMFKPLRNRNYVTLKLNNIMSNNIVTHNIVQYKYIQITVFKSTHLQTFSSFI